MWSCNGSTESNHPFFIKSLHSTAESVIIQKYLLFLLCKTMQKHISYQTFNQFRKLLKATPFRNKCKIDGYDKAFFHLYNICRYNDFIVFDTSQCYRDHIPLHFDVITEIIHNCCLVARDVSTLNYTWFHFM